MRLRTVGLLGGMSWESTAVYYRLINERVRDRAGGLRSAPLLLASVDFAEIEAYQRAGDWAAAGRVLGDLAARLEQAGAEVVALATNTMHLVADQIRARLTVPFLSLIDVVGARAAASGVRRLGLLATAFTMTSDLYPSGLAPYGIEVIVPKAADRDVVHRVIYEELCLGRIREESRAAYRSVISDLVARGADAVALGCTEIGLLVGADDSPVPVLDTTALHASAIADVVLDAQPVPQGASS
jgi:aspartate racemase